MKICVLGLWHLGTVTAACLAAGGHEVVGLDFERDPVDRLQAGNPPIFEPGLEDLVKKGLAEGRLRFTGDIAKAVQNAEVVWVTYDTPVDDEDQADTGFVLDRIQRIFPFLKPETLVITSSQLPVGSVRRLETLFEDDFSKGSVSFACLPENLRLGKAVSIFMHPDRVVAGVRAEKDRQKIAQILEPFTRNIIWMGVESAEMTKHALNAFLATSVTFINELAVICEQVGADASEVERGLKSESRIGPGAYLSPGNAFAGGTLARDINYLIFMGQEKKLPIHLFSGVLGSNKEHKAWPRKRLVSVLGDLKNKKIAVLGLTYKPGTDTLRRSEAVETCRWLKAQGASVAAYDPAVRSLPDELAATIELQRTPKEALSGAEAALIATPWPEFREIQAQEFKEWMNQPIVLDPGRHLAAVLEKDPAVIYLTVGKSL